MQLFRRLCAVDLLHLDDLGAERRTEWVLEQLYSIVNERWQDQRAIVVTTNLQSLDELREQIGRAHGLAADRDLRRPDPDHGPGPAHAPARLAALHSVALCRDS